MLLCLASSLTGQTRVPTSSTPGLDSSERPQLAPSGTNHVQVVWQDFRDGSWGVYHREAVIGSSSITFPASTDTRLNAVSSDDTLPAVDPRVAVAGTYVTVAWRELDVANRVERVMSAYINLAASSPAWSTPATLSGSLSHVHDLELVAYARNVTVAWIQSDTSFSPDQGYYARSSNYGVTWGSATRVDDVSNTDPDDTQSEIALAAGNGNFSIAYISRNGPSTQPDYNHVMIRTATGSGSFSSPVAVSTEVPDGDAQGILDLNVAMSGNGSTIAATWVLSRALMEGLRSNWSTNGGSSFQSNEAPVSEDLAPDENEGVFYSTDLAGGSGYDVYSCFTFVDTSVDGPTYVYASKLNNSSGGWLDVAQVSGPGPKAKEKGFVPLDRPRIAANSTDLVLTWMQNTATYAGDFDVQVRTAPVSSSWPPTWDSSAASVTGKSTASGMPEARSGWPHVLLHAGKAVIVWDDRENWTPPRGSGSSEGAPTVKIKAVSL